MRVVRASNSFGSQFRERQVAAQGRMTAACRWFDTKVTHYKSYSHNIIIIVIIVKLTKYNNNVKH